MNVSLIIALIIIVLIILYMVGNFFLNRRAVTELDQNEFHKGLRKAQVIDVREKVDYDYGHINGARNIPISMFRQRFQGLRKDQPVYLCDANGKTLKKFLESFIISEIKSFIKLFTILKFFLM